MAAIGRSQALKEAGEKWKQKVKLCLIIHLLLSQKMIS